MRYHAPVSVRGVPLHNLKPSPGNGGDIAARSLFPPFPGTKDIREHPVFQGRLSRWLWRLYTHRVTPPGRWLATVTIALGIIIAGTASLEIQTYILFLYVAGLWMIAGLTLLFVRPRVRLDVRHAPHGTAGEILPVDVTVTQRRGGGPLTGGDLNILPHALPLSIDAVPADGSPVPPLARTGDAARVRLGLRCHHRGAYTLKGFRVETDFPFGLLNAYRIYPQESPLLVYPAFTPLLRLDLPSGRRHNPGGVALVSKIGESFEFLGNREFREGDNIRDIDWRATARMGGEPVLREYREEFFLRIAVLLDTHVPPGLSRAHRERRREAMERAISLAAAVSESLSRQDYLIDLFAAGPNLYHLTAGRSLAYLDQILEILACVEESPAPPFAVIGPQIHENLSQITTVICLLLDWDAPRQAFVEELRASGAGVKVVLIPGENAALSGDGDAVIVAPAAFLAGIETL